MPNPPRVVLDTNLLASALVFSQGKLAALRLAWQANRLTPLASHPTTAELIRVLRYPKFRLTAQEQLDLLGDYLPWCITVTIPDPPPAVPSCQDAHDHMFMELAVQGQADYLVSGDQDLLSLNGQLPCPILSAEAFLQAMHRT